MLVRLRVVAGVALLLGLGGAWALGQPSVELPGGGCRVEFVVVVDLKADPKVAWEMDGTVMEVAKEWPGILRVGEKATHGFVIRCQRFGKGQGVDFRLSPPGATPIPGEQVPEFVTMSSEVFPTLKQGKIRVAVLEPWGPWQRMELDGTREKVLKPEGLTGKLYGLVEGVDFEHSPSSNLKVGVILRGFSGKWSRDNEVGQAEIVAHDRLGKIHRTGGVAPYGKSQIEYFKLPAAEIDHFEYRLRPVLAWITFDGVALKANAKTEVKVMAEETELSK